MIWGIYTRCEWFEVFTHVVNDLMYLHTLWMIWGIYTRCEWFEVFTHVVNCKINKYASYTLNLFNIYVLPYEHGLSIIKC